MSTVSKIEWTDATWNPVTGCTKISEGCRHCYIDRTPPFRIQHRKFSSEEIGGTTGVQLHPDRLDQPLRRQKPTRYFVNSLSDLFHIDISDEFIAKVFAVMAVARQHTFQVLTKRPRRMAQLLQDEDFGQMWFNEIVSLLGFPQSLQDVRYEFPSKNVWLGVSVENQEWADKRIPLLLETPAAVRFLSCEPLLGPVDLKPWLFGWKCDSCGFETHDLEVMHRDVNHVVDGVTHLICPVCKAAGNFVDADPLIDWVIAGGESGPKARPMHPDWARGLRDQCVLAEVPFFYKQHGEWEPVAAVYDEDGNDDYVLDDYLDTEVVSFDRIARMDMGWPKEINEGPWGQQPVPDEEPWWMAKVGKKVAGRELDGQTWDQMPEVVGR